jgi:hypothetical protein
MRRIVASLLRLSSIAAILAFASAASAACIDVRSTELLQLRGRLGYRVFPGSPGFADVRKGDYPEPTYILTLPDPICLTGDPDFADPSHMFVTVQLLPTDATAASLRALVGAEVDVTLTEPMPAMTGHHHAPLLGSVGEIAKADDPTSEYGTAATSVRGFYTALAAGSGEEAAKFIVPERRVGAFAPRAMSDYYGSLLEPLRLVSLDPSGPDRFLVRYQFRGRAGRCNGSAVVQTVTRGGSHFISSIRALDGC